MTRLIILMSLIILGCAPSREFIPQEKTEFVIDFSKYSKQNFLFTPLKYSGDYQSIGLISVSMMPEAEFKFQDRFVDSTRTRFIGSNKIWVIKKLNLESVIDTFYLKATSMGANAVIDFNIKFIKKTFESKSTNPVILPGVELTGFAIKRIDIN